MTWSRLLSLCVLASSSTALAADPIAPDRRIDWSTAGVPGGIPERTEICATIDAATYGDGVTDASAAIQQAIAECPATAEAPAVVMIPAGDFVIGSTIDLSNKSYITIRGAGASQTRLLSAGRTFMLGVDSPNLLGATVLAGATKGSTQLTLSDVEGVTVGGLLRIDRNDDAALVHSTSGPGRHVNQMVMVTAIAGGDVTFEPPLFTDFDDGPQLTGFAGLLVRETGIEDLTIDHEGGGEGPSLFFDQCYACWARGVWSRLPLGYHSIEVNNLHCEIRDSYFDDSQTYGANNAGLALYGTNTAWKVENNIFFHTFPGIEAQNSTSANYFGYNFGEQVEAGWEFSGSMFTDNHGPHDMMNLWEGNVGEMFQSDGYFGSASHGTLFRNHLTARNPAKTGNFKAISLDRWSYYYNVVGNVLGSPGTTFAFYQASADNYGYDNATIYRLGYPNLGNNGLQSYDGMSPDGIDTQVIDTLLRVGNYDYFHGCVWDDDASACLDAGAAAALELPDSLHYDGVPGWWPAAKPWPPFAAERPGFDAEAPTQIPAHDCFELLELENGGLFDADACYADVGGGDTTGGSDDGGSAESADGTGAEGNADGTADGGPAGSTAGDGTAGSDAAGQSDGGSGCGCTHDGRTPRPWLLAIVLAAVRRRRRWVAATALGIGCGAGGGGAQDDTASSLGTTIGTDGSGSSDTATATMTNTGPSTVTADGTGTTDAPIFDVGDEAGTDSGPPPNLCKVDDGEISGSAPCEEVAPPDSFDPDVQWSFTGPNGLVACMTSPLVANITDDNGDGEIDLCDIPDVITVIGNQGESGPGTIVSLAGDTGALQLMFGSGVQLGVTPALGDIDGDGLVEIVSAQVGGQLVAFEHDGTPKWTSAAVWAASQTGAIALADLDADGDVEIVAGSNVFDHQGNLLFTAPFDGLYSASTAADLDGDGDLEAIFGHAAYHHDGSEYYVRADIQAQVFSITAYPQVADLDDDPQPEVLVAVENGIWILEHDGAVKWSNFAPTGEGGDWNRPVNIHDFDGDDQAEFAISSYQHYGVYEVDQSAVFVANVVDFSGQAGGTAFDFLGSGIAQAIYADESTSWVFDIDGGVLMSTARSSGTWTEYPTVADIDNDGSAEILVGSDGNGSPTLQAIRDAQDRWIPARRIWNQHTYHVTNVREDGTIPANEPPSWQTLNTFRTQAQIAPGGGVCKPPAG